MACIVGIVGGEFILPTAHMAVADEDCRDIPAQVVFMLGKPVRRIGRRTEDW